VIDRIYGHLEIDIQKIGKSAPHRMVVLTSGGVGYEVLCSTPTIRHYIEFIQRNAEPRLVLVYEHVAEKMPTKLYGFLNDNERALFEDLLDVDGVGPKCALGICSLDSPNNVRQAIRLQNADYLRRAAGVGQKAEKIVLKLAPRMGA
jgi:holliday junction DNA helicase RuvA